MAKFDAIINLLKNNENNKVVKFVNDLNIWASIPSVNSDKNISLRVDYTYDEDNVTKTYKLNLYDFILGNYEFASIIDYLYNGVRLCNEGLNTSIKEAIFMDYLGERYIDFTTVKGLKEIAKINTNPFKIMLEFDNISNKTERVSIADVDTDIRYVDNYEWEEEEFVYTGVDVIKIKLAIKDIIKSKRIKDEDREVIKIVESVISAQFNKEKDDLNMKLKYLTGIDNLIKYERGRCFIKE